MTKIKKICIGLIIVVLLIVIYYLIGFSRNNNIKNNDNGGNDKFKIITTFYPVDLIVRNITNGAKDVEVNNITKDSNGCVHDYQLTPNDLNLIEKSNVIIINGAQMEHFIENIENIKIIDSSKEINNMGISSHIWMNIDNYIMQVNNITDGLCLMNEKNKDIYLANKDKYLQEIHKLKKIYDELEISDVNVAIMHDSFAYYANDRKFNISAKLVSGHEENISANEIKKFIEDINNTNTKVILVDNETNEENEELIKNIQNETSTKVFVIDLIVKNEENLDSYIYRMKDNIERIKEAVNYGK